MNEELIKKIEDQQVKIDAIYKSVEKTRKYFQWTFIITIVVVVLPLIISIIFLPSLIGGLNADLGNIPGLSL
ncbi:MAG: hypothetical protein WCO10_00370 [bacterium]